MERSNDFRPYFILIRKEEEKGDKYAKINMRWNTKPYLNLKIHLWKKRFTPKLIRRRWCRQHHEKPAASTARDWSPCCAPTMPKRSPVNPAPTLPIEIAYRKRPLLYLMCFIWSRCFGNILGMYVRLLTCHKMSSNVYLFALQTFKIFAEHLSIDSADLPETPEKLKMGSLVTLSD